MKQEKKSVYLLKNIFLFFICNFMPKAITFFMVPLYTYCLSTHEYGTIDLLNTTIQLLLPFLTLQIQDAMLRFSLEKKNAPSDVLTIGLRIILLGSILLFIACFIEIKFNLTGINPTYIFIFFILYVLHAFRNIASYFCRGIGQVGILTTSNVAVTFLTVLCNLLFLLVFKWGILGYLLASCVGNFVGVVILFSGAKLHQYIKLNISDKTLTKQIIIFSLPMIFSALSWWINSSLDKYILRYFRGASAVGLLAVAYKIPSILSLFGITIANAYSISAIKEFDPNDSDGFLGNSYSIINTFFVLLCTTLMLINVPLAKLLFSNDFFPAWKYVPPLLLSALMSQLFLMCEQFYIALKKTSIISLTAIFGALINTVLNIVFIPSHGIYGACVATAISTFSVWMIRYTILTKYIKLKHNLLIECISYILLLLQTILAYNGNRFLLYQLIIAAIMFLLYTPQIKNILSTILHLKTFSKSKN